MNSALALSRVCQYLTQMGVFGACGFVLACAPPTLQGILRHLIRHNVGWAARINLLACLVFLPIEAIYIAGDITAAWQPGTLWLVATQTSIGHAWGCQAVLAVAWLVALHFRPVSARVSFTFTGLLLACQALMGHAVMHEGILGALHQAVQAVHMWSTGAWIGALCLLPLLMLCLNQAETREAAGLALRRFSSLWQGVVALALASGVLDTYLVVGGWPGDLNQPYQRLLWLKVLAVLGMTALALVNRYRWVPQLQTQGAHALSRIARNAALALFLGFVALALVSYLGLLAPTMDMDM